MSDKVTIYRCSGVCESKDEHISLKDYARLAERAKTMETNIGKLLLEKGKLAEHVKELEEIKHDLSYEQRAALEGELRAAKDVLVTAKERIVELKTVAEATKTILKFIWAAEQQGLELTESFEQVIESTIEALKKAGYLDNKRDYRGANEFDKPHLKISLDKLEKLK